MKTRYIAGSLYSIPAIAVMLFSLIIFPGCGDENLTGGSGTGDDPAGSLVSSGSCKSFDATMTFDDPSPSNECFTYSYSTGGELSITHINAGLNCCPGTITSEITIDERTITINEHEGADATWCHCLCLYDIGYLFTDIDPGIWTIIFKGPCTGDDPDLQEEIRLGAANESPICIERNFYPWDEDYTPFPAGELLRYDGCKYTDAASDPFDNSSGETCAEYEYDGKTLFIDHIDAVFNCCQYDITADITIDDNVITITESEYPPGGLCDCICLFDLSCIVRNLPPGIYTIRFVEPYLSGDDPELEFIADLSSPCSGRECAPRSHYPWGGD
ncbi:MAG: hypothetical protein JW814_01265 [Candidatus Krumholzibacteriota bacterium]|nr:hypothetical protein [Candidatus Krumholzibacteriota bacterium]